MGITRVLALSAAWIVISTTSLSATPELSRYRGFEFGMSVVTVARHAGISPEPRIVHQRPELIEELMWLPPRLGMAPVTPGPNADDKIVAHWEDPQYSITLFRSKYLSTFGLVLLSKRLDGLTALANAEAILLDERDAPARETARQQRRTDEDRLREETVRRVNKAAFKP